MTLEDFKGMHAIEFPLDALAILHSPGVYMYCAGDRALYVGASKRISGRILARNHHRKSELKSATSLLIFPCQSWQEANALESCLCAECRPQLNMRNGAMVRAKRVCESLGMTAQSVIHQYLIKPTA